PFFLLLFRSVKQNLRAVTVVAALVLAMQLVFVDYQVVPSFPYQPLTARWMEVLMPVGLGCIWLTCVLWLFESRPLFPLHDRNWPQVEHLWRLEQAEAASGEVLAHG